jgi:hypothetical protein
LSLLRMGSIQAPDPSERELRRGCRIRRVPRAIPPRAMGLGHHPF